MVWAAIDGAAITLAALGVSGAVGFLGGWGWARRQPAQASTPARGFLRAAGPETGDPPAARPMGPPATAGIPVSLWCAVTRALDVQVLYAVQLDVQAGLLRFTLVSGGDAPAWSPMELPVECLPDADTLDGPHTPLIAWDRQDEDRLVHCLLVLDGRQDGDQWAHGLLVQIPQGEEARHRLIRQARLADLGRLSASISHELKQPLATMAMAVQSLRLVLDAQGRSPAQPLDPAPVERAAGLMRKQIDRARAIIDHMMDYARTGRKGEALGDVEEAVRAGISFLQPLLDEQGIEVTLQLAVGAMPVGVAQFALEQVVVNALQNAADAVRGARAAGREAGALQVRTWREGGAVHCAIVDDGVGLPPDVRGGTFRPFFTTKAADKGLGLFVSRQIISEAGGRIALQANPGHGATLVFNLPAQCEQGNQSGCGPP